MSKRKPKYAIFPYKLSRDFIKTVCKLVAHGFLDIDVKVCGVSGNSELLEISFILTPKGKDAAKFCFNRLPENLKQTLTELKRYNEMSLEALSFL